MNICENINPTGWLKEMCANNRYPVISSVYNRLGEKISSIFGNATVELMSYDQNNSGFEIVGPEGTKFVTISGDHNLHEIKFGYLQQGLGVDSLKGKTWTLTCFESRDAVKCSSETFSHASENLDVCSSNLKTAWESLTKQLTARYWITTDPELPLGTMNREVPDNNPELHTFSHYLDGKNYVNVSLSDYALPIAKLAAGVSGAAFCGYKCFREVSQLVSDYKNNKASEQTKDKPNTMQATGSKAKALAYMVGTLAFGTFTAMTAINDFSDPVYSTNNGGWVKFV